MLILLLLLYREMLVGSDRCLGEIVSEMQAAVETSDPEDGQVRETRHTSVTTWSVRMYAECCSLASDRNCAC
jgi:hypothetical protein